MFFIFPVGHSSSTVRRQPWMSYLIIAANIFIFFFLTHTYTTSYELLQYVEDIVELIQAHPEVELSPARRNMLADHVIEEHDKAKRQSQEAATKRQEDGLAKAMPRLDRLTHHLQRIEDAAVQAELDQLTKKLLALTQGGVYQK